MSGILIVDDDYDVRDALIDVLADEGYPVQAVSDGHEALEFLREHELPGLILLDWMMPRCDATQFRAEQRKDRRLANIPVVLLTADARGADKLRSLEAEGFLAKPVSVERLLEVVSQYCAPEPQPSPPQLG